MKNKCDCLSMSYITANVDLLSVWTGAAHYSIVTMSAVVGDLKSPASGLFSRPFPWLPMSWNPFALIRWHIVQTSARLLHSHSLVAKGLSVPGVWDIRHGLQLAGITLLWLVGLNIDWDFAPLHYGLTWPVGIPTVFHTPVTVPMHSSNLAIPAVRVVQGDCEIVQNIGRQFLARYRGEPMGPICSHGLTLIPVWISNDIPSKVWDEITYPFQTDNGCTVQVWEWVSNLSHTIGWM